ISTRQSEMVALDTRAAALLVRVRTYTDREAGTVDETFYFADRAIRYDYGNTGTVREFWPFLLGATPLSVAMNRLPDPGGLARRRELTVRLPNVPHEEGGVPLLERLRQTNIE